MKKYHKIQSVFKRDMENPDKSKRKNFLLGQYTRPEFKLLKDIQWRFDEKLDGTNVRISYGLVAIPQIDGTKFTERVSIAGREAKSTLHPTLQDRLKELFPIENFKKEFGELDFMNPEDGCKVVLYGEGVGKKIQKNGHLYLVNDEHPTDFVLFDIRIGSMWLRRDSVEDIAEKLGIRVAPIIRYGTLQDAIEMCKNGFESVLKDTPPEGLVCRPVDELLDRRGHRIITKVKLKDFR